MRCVVCGQPETTGMCDFHMNVEIDWAVANRIMCDLIHRGIVPKRLTEREREDFPSD